MTRTAMIEALANQAAEAHSKVQHARNMVRCAVNNRNVDTMASAVVTLNAAIAERKNARTILKAARVAS